MSDAFDGLQDLSAEAVDSPSAPLTPDPVDPTGPAPEEVCAGFPLNDFGNGRRMQVHFGRDCVWVPRVGWFVWTGQVWAKDSDLLAMRARAQQMGALIEREVPHLSLPEGDEAKAKRIMRHFTHARTAGNSAPMANMISEAGVGLSRDLTEMDADPLAINTLSGLIRISMEIDEEEASWCAPGVTPPLRAHVRLTPHQRADLQSKLAPVAFVPGSPAPRFDAFLRRVQPDPEMRAFLQRWFGLCLTGMRLQQLLVLFGSGANGKSVLVDLIARILGDYAATARIESLTGSNRRDGGAATPDLIPLIGARFARASEPGEGERLQEGLIKELTGGEDIMVRPNYGEFVAVKPQFKLVISTNHKPDIRGTDDGIWRRVLLMDWLVQIPEAERDADLGEKLWGERAGIFNWMIAGLVDALENGLRPPSAVLEATQEFREESDPVGTFLETCCVATGDPADTITARELGDAFNWWLADRGDSQWKPTTVSRRLADKSKRWRSRATQNGFTARKSSTIYYDGIRLTDTFGRRFRDAPRDLQGRATHGRAFARDDE